MCIILMAKRRIKKEINLNTWYFKVEGKGDPNSEIDYAFGFYVNCLVCTKESIEDAKNSILKDLNEDGYVVEEIEYAGNYNEFSWDNKEIQQELDELAYESEKKPNTIHYSNFHTWKY